MHRALPYFCLLAAVLASPPLLAAPLAEARVTKIINDVKVVDPIAGDRNAKLEDVIGGDLALTTGIKSRSELLFQDNTLTRLGPESYFSFKTGSREMTLQKGTLLLQVPKGIGGAKIHTAAVTAAITGTTIMMEYQPNKTIKVLVLEGSLRLSMNGRFGDSLLMTPGRMIIMSPNAKRIPDPVTVDLKKVVNTSTLVNMKKGKEGKSDPLPSIGLIDKEIDQQQQGKDGRQLVDTNLVILGKGTNVLLGSDDLLAEISVRTDIEKLMSVSVPVPSPQPTPEPLSTPAATPNPNPTPNTNPPPTGTQPPPFTPYTTDHTTVINTASSAPKIVSAGLGNIRSGVFYRDLQTNGSPAGFLFGSASLFDNSFGFDAAYLQEFKPSAVFTFDSLKLGGGINFNTGGGGTNSVALIGNNGITNSAASVVSLGGISEILFATRAGNIVLDSGISFTANNDFSKPAFVEFYARGGDLKIGSIFSLNNSTLEFAAENSAVLGASAAITAKNLTITGLQNVQFDGHATSSLFQLNGGAVEMGGDVTAKAGFFYGTSAAINGTFSGETFTADVTGNFSLNGKVTLIGSRLFQVDADGTATIAGPVAGNVTVNAQNIVFGADFTVAPGAKGELTANGGNIDATGHSVSGFDQISANGGILSGGSITADTITANGLQVDNLTATKTLTVKGANLAPYATDTISINTPSLSLLAGATLDGINGTPLLAPGSASKLAITTGSFTFGTNVSLNGGDGDVLASDAGGNGGRLDVTSNNAITVNSPITATTGQNSTIAMTGGNGGTVNLTAQNSVTLNNKIEVSSNDGSRRRSASGGNINITSNAGGGTAIAVTSSAQLLALLNAAAPGLGGSIKFVSAGGNVDVNGATMQADRGTIDIRNNGGSGAVTVNNATLNASTIKMGALGDHGTLNVGGGTISADTIINLYAGGSNGTVNFTDDVTLNGNSVKTIAGDTVKIFNGKIVTVNGPTPADVFTNHPNYTGFGGNGSTTGTFAGQGATTQPLSAKPGF